jgi:hypothetical protein
MKIDLAELKKRADRSNRGESYEVIDKNEEYQFGVGYERVSESELRPYLELLVCLCRGGTLKMNELESRIRIIKAIESRGYKLTCIDDGSISCEASMDETLIESEVEAISDIMRIGHWIP